MTNTTMIADIVKALKPFAEMASIRDGLDDSFNVYCKLSDLRAARTALDRAKQQLDLDNAEKMFIRLIGEESNVTLVLVIPLRPITNADESDTNFLDLETEGGRWHEGKFTPKERT